MINVMMIEPNIYLFILCIVANTFRISDIMRAVKVIVTILRNDYSNRLRLKTIIIIPW